MMNPKLYGVLTIALLATLANGCTRGNEVVANSSDNGKQIDMNPGQVLAVSLEANPSTGYTWEASEGPGSILQQIGEPEFQPETESIGSPGIQTLRFESLSAGQTTLTLVYHRPFEQDVEPLKTFSLQVVVR